VFPLHDLIYCIATEVKNGTMLSGIFNGAGASRLDVFDGLTLIPGVDMVRPPTATAMICERAAELSGGREADERLFAELSSRNPLAPAGSVPEHIVKHLARDFGPQQLALGGDWLLNLSLNRSLTRGPDYETPPDLSNTVGGNSI